ncbi:hypothetical protein N7510_008819 [Penicillium lagena]|uniref:uncharacterized protein n=1 Tax=Penicillium lagena TaxID=94218 RepID=UPI002541B471|nr:uncharacterized protein N7510_008819 [Penicillium lagena]KAJ5606038.1 hypothetical protein N7510_008819 [Penicillium lagena]
MLYKGAAMLLLPLLQGVSADWTTTITTILTVSNGFTPVVDFTTTSSFNSKHSHREQFSTIVTVPNGMMPIIHYSSMPAHSASSGGSLAPPSSTSRSSIPLAPSRGSSSSSASETVPPEKTSPNSNAPTSTPRLPSSGLYGSSIPHPGGLPSSGLHPSGSASATALSSSSRHSQPTPGATSASGASSAGGLGSTYGASSQFPSAALSSAPDLNSLTPTGSSSAEESAILAFGPTGAPSSAPWGTLTVLPSGTITGTPAYSEATNIAIFLKGFYNNIGLLKTDPKTYKKNLQDVENQAENYLSKIDYPSEKSPCSGSLRKRSLFGDIGNLASSAANVAAGAVNAAKNIAEDAISCIKPIADDMIKTIPDDVSKLTDDIEDTVKKGSKYLDEISNILNDMENKAKDDENENSSSNSESSTSSSSSSTSCSSSTTFSDCTTTTVLVSTYSTGADATAPLISGECYEYTSFPSKITLTPSWTPTAPTATPVPFITTETDGEILSYPSQIFQNFATEGVGAPVTLQTPSPSQTSGNDKGSGECHSIDDACTRAYEQYVDDTVYSSYTSYTANIESGIIVDATFGTAGCAAMYSCDNNDYGFGMTGRQIKAAVEYMMANDSASKCGTTYLSNSCQITLNYCTSCSATQ